MVDLLESVRRDIDERLKHLRPAVEESQKLEKALEALGRTGVRIPSEAERAPRKAQRRRTRVTRAEAEARKRQALAMLAEDPQTKPAAIAAIFEMSPNNVYSMLRRLEREGALSKTQDGYRVQQPESRIGS